MSEFRISVIIVWENMLFSGEIYTTGKNFTLPPVVTNPTSVCHLLQWQSTCMRLSNLLLLQTSSALSSNNATPHQKFWSYKLLWVNNFERLCRPCCYQPSPSCSSSPPSPPPRPRSPWRRACSSLTTTTSRWSQILSRVSLIIASAYYSGPTLRISNHLYWPNEIRTNAH